MAANQSTALKHWARIIQRWPVDKVRPDHVSFQTIMKRRVERLTNPSLNTAPSSVKANEALASPPPAPVTFDVQKEMKQVNALYSLLENRFASAYPIPDNMRYPASRKTHYDDWLAEMEAAPTRSKFTRFMQSLKGRFRSQLPGDPRRNLADPRFCLYICLEQVFVVLGPSIILTCTMPSTPQVVVLDPYHDDALQVLRSDASIDLIIPQNARKDAALSQATGILVRSESRISAADLHSAGSNLKFIVKQGMGVDNIDLVAAKAKRVGIYNTPGVNAESVAELTLTLALCIARRVTEFDRQIRGGQRVVRSKMLGKSLHGRTLGVVGMGAIGSEVARKWATAMGGPIIAFDPYASTSAWTESFSDGGFTRVQNLHELLRQADVVTLHVPLTDGTKDLIAEKEFNAMKDDSIILNCARGGVVNEDDLLKALQSGKLFGAGLDAVLQEPPTVAGYGDTLLTHPRVILTPHVGASTAETQSRSGVRAAEIMLDLIHGRGDHKSLV